jgi:site-specific DNA-methyltransferase (adenine-specific)
MKKRDLNDYSNCYDTVDLANKMNNLEMEFGVEDFEGDYKNLVNPSRSKNHPFYSWGRYREAYSGELVRKLILVSSLNPTQEIVVDPMCGSGSTLLASAELGFDAFGLDVMPYSVKLSQSKFIELNDAQIRLIEEILDQILDSEFQPSQISSGEESIRRYFNNENFLEVLAIKQVFSQINDKDVFTLCKIAWLSILEECSNKKKDGNGLATKETKITDCFQYFKNKLETMMTDIKNRNYELKNTDVFCESATSLAETVHKSLENKTVGLVIFSPPYANSFDYFESYKIELIMGGWYTLKTLPEGRKKAIRSYRKGYRNGLLSSEDDLINLLCDEIDQRRKNKEEMSQKKDNRNRLVPNLIVGYFSDMEAVLSNIFEILPSGKSCYIVVDQSSYLGAIIPTDLLLAYLGRRLGFVVEPIMYCRPSNTSPQQSKQFPYLKSMLRESIVHLKKS